MFEGFNEIDFIKLRRHILGKCDWRNTSFSVALSPKDERAIECMSIERALTILRTDSSFSKRSRGYFEFAWSPLDIFEQHEEAIARIFISTALFRTRREIKYLHRYYPAIVEQVAPYAMEAMISLEQTKNYDAVMDIINRSPNREDIKQHIHMLEKVDGEQFYLRIRGLLEEKAKYIGSNPHVKKHLFDRQALELMNFAGSKGLIHKDIDLSGLSDKNLLEMQEPLIKLKITS